jgi:hypoxanthine phosphoribosyltransferase
LSNLEPLIDADRLQRRIAELAAEIRRDYGGRPILAVGVLKGSVYFLADLTRLLGEGLELDFMQVSSYRGEKSSSGVVQIRKDLDTNIEGRDVLLVEDIVDTGATLDHLRELLQVRKPASLKVVSLLSKRTARGIRTPVEYVGFEIPEAFVVGYGLDYGERFRNLPFISILREDSTTATATG